MISENMFLDIIADVDPAYVEEVLFMPQFAEDNSKMEKYRKKSNFGKIFGSVAACAAVAAVGITVVMLHNKGFFSTPGESTTDIRTDKSVTSELTVPEKTTEAENTHENTEKNPDPYDYQELVIALGAVIDKAETFEEMFAGFDELNAGDMIVKTVVYENSELRDQGTAMTESQLKGNIPMGIFIQVFFSTGETDYAEFGKFNKARLPEGVTLEGIRGDIITEVDISGVTFSADNPEIWQSAQCEGFAYLAEPKGVSFNSVDNKDMFDAANWFSGNAGVSDSDYNYKRYYLEDKICGLTVKNADLSFLNMVDTNVGNACRISMGVSFEGTVTLTGYINTYTSEDGFVNSQMERAVYFAPDAESSKKLPVFKGFNSPTESTLITEYLSDNFSFYGEHVRINLGYSNDFSDYPDNEAVKVRVTISDLTYTYSQGGPVSSWANAQLQKVEVID